MNYVILGIFLLVTLFLLRSITNSARYKQGEKVVVLSKLLLIVGTVVACIFLIPTIILMISDNSPALSLFFALFTALCTSLVIAYFNCTITYNETEFTHKNFLGIERTYSYNEITGVHGKKRDVKIFIGKRSFRVDEATINKDEFIAFVRKQYRKSNDGNAIPIANPKTDIFKGNIENPGEFIFVYSLVMAFLIGCLILVTVLEISNSSKEVLSSTVSFVRYAEDDNMLSLYTSDDKEYRIGNYQDVLSDLDGLIGLCNGEERLDVKYTFHDDEVRPIHRLKSITAEDGTVWLSEEVVERVGKANTRFGFLLMGGIVVFMAAFFAASIYVGRNVEKVKPWIVKMFFRSSYVNWK